MLNLGFKSRITTIFQYITEHIGCYIVFEFEIDLEKLYKTKDKILYRTASYYI